MKKLTLSQVKALVKKNNTLEVQLFPSNCGPANTTWVKGYPLLLATDRQNNIESINFNHYDQYTPLNDVVNSFSYYNCNNELGNRVHYYIEETN